MAGHETKTKNWSAHLWDDQSSISYLATPVFLPHLSFTEFSLVHSAEARQRSATEEIDVLAIPSTAQCLRTSIWRDSPSDRGQNYSRVLSRWNLQCTSFWKSAGTFRARPFYSSVSSHFHLISSHFTEKSSLLCIAGINKIVYSMATPSVVILSKYIFFLHSLTFVSLFLEKFAYTFFLFQ